MKKAILILCMLVLLCSSVLSDGMGVVPSELDMGKVKRGGKYKGEIKV